MCDEKLISIHLNSNRPDNFNKFIISLISNAIEIKYIEVIVSIDKNDIAMLDIIRNINIKYPNLITSIETDLIKSFSDAWKPLNILLKNTSNSVRYISCMSDEIIFQTKSWDSKILKYDNFFNDNIFRIRCSKNRNEVYSDIWECGYKPDSIAFYTKKWLDAVGQWNPCIGPDTFQECVSYYMNNYGRKYQRNIIDFDLKFDGEEVSENLNLKERIKRSRIYYKAFFKLMSYKVQNIASLSAYNLVNAIDNTNTINNYIQISRKKTYFRNFTRRFNFFYYRGSKNHIIDTKTKNFIFMIWCYIEFFDNHIIKVLRFLYKTRYLEKVIKNEKKFKQIEKVLKSE